MRRFYSCTLDMCVGVSDALRAVRTARWGGGPALGAVRRRAGGGALAGAGAGAGAGAEAGAGAGADAAAFVHSGGGPRAGAPHAADSAGYPQAVGVGVRATPASRAHL